MPDHVKIGILDRNHPHIDLATQDDCVNVDPKYKIEIVIKGFTDRFDFDPSALPLPIVFVDDAHAVVMRQRKGAHAWHGKPRKRLMGRIVGC